MKEKMSKVKEMSAKLDEMERLFPSLSSQVAILKKDVLLLWTITFYMPINLTRDFFWRNNWDINELNDRVRLRIEDIELNSFTPIATVEKLITASMEDLKYTRQGTIQLYATHLQKQYVGDEWGFRSDEVCRFVDNLVEVQQEVLVTNEQAATDVQSLRSYIDLTEYLAKVFESNEALVTKIWLRARAVADLTAIFFYSLITETETEKMNFLDHLLLYLEEHSQQHPLFLKDYSEKLILCETLVKACVSYSPLSLHNISAKIILYGSIIKHATTPLSFSFSKDSDEKKNLHEGYNQLVDHFVHYNRKSLMAQLKKFSEYMALLKVNVSYPPLRYMFGKMILEKGIGKLVIILFSIDVEKDVEDDTWKEKNIVLPREFDMAYFIDEFEKFMEDAKEIHDLQLDMKYKVVGEEAIGEYIDGLEELQKQYLSSNKQAISSIQNLRSFQRLSEVIDEDLMNKSQLLLVVEHTTKFLCLCWIEPEENQEFKLTQLLQMTSIKDPNVRSIYEHSFKSWPDKHVVSSFIDYLLFYIKELIQYGIKSIVASSKEKLENLHMYLTNLRKVVTVEDIEPSSRVQLMPNRMQQSLHSLVIKFLMTMAMAKSTFINDLEEDEGEKNLVLLHDLEETFTLMKTEVRKSFTFDYPFVGGDFVANLKNLEELPTLKTDLISPLKHDVDMVYAALLKLRPFLDEIKDKSVEKKEPVNDLQQRIIKVSYQADFIIQSYMNRDCPTYYHFLQLSVIKDDIQLLIIEMKEHDTSNAADTMVGFVDESETIFDQVNGNSEKRNIVAIVGMPGLGKTTIAKNVYNHSSVANRFDRRAWCSVSQSYQTRELLLQILRCINVVNDDQIRKKNNMEIANLLKQSLIKRRYLIVLDDVWETKVWEDLKKSFPDDNNGSRVIVTSRDLKLAQTLIQTPTDGYVHPLREFRVGESCELLERKLFPAAKFPEALYKIAEQCKGLPLTVVLAAGILSRMEKNKDLWVAFGESLGTQIFNEEGNRGRNIIELSYTHLPDHLKCCFLYFGAFPEGMDISAAKLTRLWIAEGFVRDANAERLEDIAEHYLMELIGRNLVLGSKSVFSPGIKSCHVHDLVREFCIAKADEENFLQVVRGYDKVLPPNIGHFDYGVDSTHEQDSSKITHPQYRLSIYSRREQFILAKPFGPNARTLFFHALGDMEPNCQYDASFISHYFKLIKVLDLGSLNIGDSFTEIALIMLHLRYLEVEGKIGSIPEIIDNLRKLETLIVEGSSPGVISVPNSIWKLLKLRHLHLDGYTSIKFNSKGIAESTKLTDMESFSTPTISYGDDMEEVLRRFPNLRKLKCIFLDSWDDSKKCNQFPVLEFLTQLLSLKVLCSYKSFQSSERYPCSFSFPKNLTKLTLSEFGLPWSEISPIGRLPNLIALKLLSGAFTGSTWDMGDGDNFPSLKFLKLESLDVEEWSATEEHIPSLERLILSKCENLEQIPYELGGIETLEIIEVLWCNPSAGTSARSIKETAVEYGNDSLNVDIYPNEDNSGASS